jgi:hypothetical protein
METQRAQRKTKIVICIIFTVINFIEDSAIPSALNLSVLIILFVFHPIV